MLLTASIQFSVLISAEDDFSEPNYEQAPINEFAPTSILGYHNLTEVENKLFDISVKYFDIAMLYDLGKLYPHRNGTPKRTVQGRPIWALKLSDNPAQNESAEPEVLYMAMHHAREWISVEVILYVIDYIIDNYKTNSTLGWLVNNTELWFVPVVNPDGFHYSQYGRDDINNTNSNQWRKNCNETNGLSGFQDYNWAHGDGVDLNRNYGYQWGYDDTGSSPNADNQLYRGSAPFSEVETQIIRDFALDHEFKLAISYHSYSDLIIFPWAYDNYDTPHDALFNEIACNMSQYNGYPYGNSKDGTIYNCNGEASDWFYFNRSCLAFTFELHASLFIPQTNQILPICQKNLEPSLLIGLIADDPYKVVHSGVRGQVTTTQGKPIAGVNISTKFATDTLRTTTNETGHYILRVPPGSYILIPEKAGFWANSFNIAVIKDNYSLYNFQMEDMVPPIISQVWANDSAGVNDSFPIGSLVTLNVRELNSELDLTGTVRITSISTGFNSGKQALSYDGVNELYSYTWNTSGLTAAEDYIIEATLKDFDQNIDGNGSNNTGPDLILKLLDKIPPVVHAVDTYSLNSGTPVDDDEVYELGSTVRVVVYERVGEKWLNGTLRITSDSNGYESSTQELIFNEKTNRYYWDWNTTGLEIGDDYEIETTLRDKWGNVDLDGLPESPDITITLVDTTPPLITKLDSYSGEFSNELYELGSEVTIVLSVSELEPVITGYITITSQKTGFKYNSSVLLFDIESQNFYIIWNTTSLNVSDDYFVEGRVADKYLNYDLDGSDTQGPDLVIRLVDTTSPIISSVTSFVGADSDNEYEVGLEVSFIVKEANAELNLTGTIRINSITNSYDSGIQTLTYDNELLGYTWLWDTTGLEPASDFIVETTLIDVHNNKDLDGSSPSDDLIITLVDTIPPVISDVWSKVRTDMDGIYELGSEVVIVVEESAAEPELTGSIRITSPKTGFDLGPLALTWDNKNTYYYYRWITAVGGLRPSDDYGIETSLADKWGNIDSDGLVGSPDIKISLVDTTPPKQTTSLSIQQNETNKNVVYLSWSPPEINCMAVIYRSSSNITVTNIADLEPIATSDIDYYTDILLDTPGTYYYVVLMKDQYGNINQTITQDNSGQIYLPPKTIEDETKDDHDESALLGLSLLCFGLVIFILVIIVIIIIAVFLILRRKKRESMEAGPGVDAREAAEVSGVEELEDWSSRSGKEKPSVDEPQVDSKTESEDVDDGFTYEYLDSDETVDEDFKVGDSSYLEE